MKIGNRFRDLSNQRFNRLKAINRTKIYRNGTYYWKCICDCGNICEILGTNLTTGHCGSCGCLQKDKTREILYSGGNYITGAEWKSYRNGAKSRDLSFFPTLNKIEAINYIEEIFEKQDKKCKLTKLDVYFNSTVREGNGKIILGNASIDRIDNNIGYEIDNIQIIHKDINLMKHAFNLEYFKTMCKLITIGDEK